MRSCLHAAIAGCVLVAIIATASPAMAQNKLDRKVADSSTGGNALVDVLDFIAEISGINMNVDWPALEAAGISKDTPVTARVRDVTVRKALRLVLDSAAGADVLTFYFDQGVLEVTTKEVADQRLITRIYPIEDLLFEVPNYTDAPEFTLTNIGQGGTGGGGGQSIIGGGGGGGTGTQIGASRSERVAAIIAMITQTIRPEIWRENGGTASIGFIRGNLIVTAPRSVHEQLSNTWR